MCLNSPQNYMQFMFNSCVCRLYSRTGGEKMSSDSEIIARYIGESRHFIPEITPVEFKARRIVNSRQRTILFYETLWCALENAVMFADRLELWWWLLPVARVAWRRSSRPSTLCSSHNVNYGSLSYKWQFRRDVTSTVIVILLETKASVMRDLANIFCYIIALWDGIDIFKMCVCVWCRHVPQYWNTRR